MYVLASLCVMCSSMFVAEFGEDVRSVISTIVEHLENPNPDVRLAAMELLSRLAEQGTC